MEAQVMATAGGRRFGPSSAWQASCVGDRVTLTIAGTGAGRQQTPARGFGRSSARRGCRGGEVARRPGGRRSAGVNYDRVRLGVACADDAVEAPYRMGRWARLSMSIIVTLAVIVGAFAVLAPSAVPTESVTVAPGETLLSIALRDMPGTNPADAVDLLVRLNGLTDSAVAPGMHLLVPAN